MSKQNMFDGFIKTNLVKNNNYTHTRIPDKTLQIFGGKYQINKENIKDFNTYYYDKVFNEKKSEYMTEKQLIEDGPILVDLDFAYDKSITTKQHTSDHVIDLIMLYGDILLEMYKFTDNFKLDVFILEKNKVNCLENKTKDGIHIIFGLKSHKAAQSILRNKVIEKITNIWDDIPIKNTWNDVFDEGVTKGHCNWQMYGSKKPNHEAYLIKKFYSLSLKNKEWNITETPIKLFDTKRNINKLSARYTDHPEAELNDAFKETFEIELNNLAKKNKSKTTKTVKPLKNIINNNINFNLNELTNINSSSELDDHINNLFDTLDNSNYKIKETHQYTLCLPVSYYGPGSYSKWIRVGWALANTSNLLFLTWIKFSSREICRDSLKNASGTFDWKMISELYEMWSGFNNNNADGLSNRSIMYWAKNDAYAEYMDIRKETIDYYILHTLSTPSPTEFDLANVLFHIFKDRFVCVSIKNNCWYEYKKHRWFEIDSGNTLRLCISKEMHHEYVIKTHETTNLLDQIDPSQESTHDSIRKKAHKLTEIAMLLKKTQWKNNIMREARELFYDYEFINKLDQNPYLLCFNNYVIDFKNKIHRKGQPDDYISKSTNIDYIRLTKKHTKTMEEIKLFIEELFPIKELRDYMWEHLASILIGTTENQTFNIYTGSGRNGKSCLVDLMSKCLGDYKGTVPITLITQKRNSIGSTSSEIVQLMGTRYAVMQEPSKGDKINEGIMKEITGGDPIQGRALWKDTVTFIPQFKLVVCTNTLFDIKSNDDGTWRRIRVCDFKSKFLENPDNDDNFPKDEFPYQYKLDKKIDKKFKEWSSVFMSMLVNLAYKLGGNVKDCDMVMASSKEYREGQDYIAEFIKDKIIKKSDSKIRKTELLHTFREWYTTNYGRGVPKGKELYDIMDKKYGRYKNGWHNVSILYDDDDDLEENEL
jgi:P4 family phage/plasmid primase-like protien